MKTLQRFEPPVDYILYHKDEPFRDDDNKIVCYAARDIWLSSPVRKSDFIKWQVDEPNNISELARLINFKPYRIPDQAAIGGLFHNTLEN